MPPELACEFMAVFSRLEYALKSTQYALGNEKKVDPAWDSFANDIDQQFMAITQDDVVESRNYLLGRPPKKQVLKNKKVVFIDQVIDPKQARTQQLLLMVRTVRNNLFHGGKYLPDGEQEADRDHRLVHYSLIVLFAVSRLDEYVKSSFEH